MDEMSWSMDNAPDTFHVGAGNEQTTDAVATFIKERNEQLRGWKQYRLRGMAVHPTSQGHGLGTKLLLFGLEHLRAVNADLLWCNARENALAFYSKAGFTLQGNPFLIEGIGIHHLMYLRL